MRNNSYKCFNPLTDQIDSVPDESGNYIVVLRPEIKLPDLGTVLEYSKFNGCDVIYTGIASQSLRERDIKGHLGNNAGRSTLRKSLGCLFGYTLIPRDKEMNGKTKFNDRDEQKLTSWMTDNLIFFYYPNDEYESLEDKLIAELNPPLNLSKNRSPVNKEFRLRLSALRVRSVSDCGGENNIYRVRAEQLAGGQNLYVPAWSQSLGNILNLIRAGGGSVQLDSGMFTSVGNRQTYSFRLDTINGSVPVKRGSAVARDLKRVLDSSVEFRTSAKGKRVVIRLDSKFRLQVICLKE